MGDLRNQIRELQEDVVEIKTKIKDADYAHRTFAKKILQMQLDEAQDRLERHSALLRDDGFKIGELTEIYELTVVEGVQWDYCLVRVEKNRVGVNRVAGREIFEVIDWREAKHRLAKVGRTTDLTIGEFVHTDATYSAHPRFPGTTFHMPSIAQNGVMHSGGMWCAIGDSGAPIITRNAAVGIVLGNCIPDPPYEQLNLGICSPLGWIISRIKAKFGMELELYVPDE